MESCRRRTARRAEAPPPGSLGGALKDAADTGNRRSRRPCSGSFLLGCGLLGRFGANQASRPGGMRRALRRALSHWIHLSGDETRRLGGMLLAAAANGPAASAGAGRLASGRAQDPRFPFRVGLRSPPARPPPASRRVGDPRDARGLRSTDTPPPGPARPGPAGPRDPCPIRVESCWGRGA